MRNMLIELEIVGAVGVPLTIANTAKKRANARHSRSSFEKQDEIWVVFDQDEHPKVKEAIQICVSADIKIAFSNPCFELWLILHYQNFDCGCDRHHVQKAFQSLCSDYDRSRQKTTDFSKLMPFIADAETRAEQQLKKRKDEGDPLMSPVTTVFELTRQIRKANNGSL